VNRDDEKTHNAYPEAPDLKRVRDLRARLHADKVAMEKDGAGPGNRRTSRIGKTAKDIGTYTLIPSLMVAGPVVGYALGHLVEKTIGGEPWSVAGGMLLGIVASFRQVFLLLKRQGTSRPPP